MDEMTLIVGAILVAASAFLIVTPLVSSGQKRNQASEGNQVLSLNEELTQIITTIRDLDFDYDMGKVPQSVYVDHRKELIGRGVSTLIRPGCCQ